jgi:hypothetical protein
MLVALALIPESATIFAWVRSTDQHSTLPIDPNRLTTTVRFIGSGYNTTKPLQPRHNHVRDAGFESVNAIVVKAASEIERLLDVHVVAGLLRVMLSPGLTQRFRRKRLCS